MLFNIEPVTVKILGQELKVKPLPVSKMLEFRDRYEAAGENDAGAIIKLMCELIILCVETPKITDADLDAIGKNHLKTIFDAVGEACGLIAEKKEIADKTT